jgi:hypothetical protein
MATSQTAIVYNKATGVGTTALVMTATSVADATGTQVNGISFDYFVELTAGNAATRVPISRDDFLAIRQLRNLAVP